MKGYKDSTKTQYLTGKSPGSKGAAKVASVMREFKSGELHSGSKSGPKVKDRKQAVAIALSEARRHPMKKAEGGRVVETGYGPNISGRDAMRDRNALSVPMRKAEGGRVAVRPRGPLIGS